ncbi:hypothetical protein [Bradyrhizobium guangdongense]|uniref:Uncharacterized protein n=1 Tax=Bradyrhizobium guangdongense TaxID=1325090 RepID=A0A410VH45_9BRAD|nr:hypothetical protein [Bradyrhizobium guangdongense]QAU43006.1 hypothetical protein X265_30430 [Bradyrhizobium guangdongense]QOZ64061.1 hypothetical protein XH86_30470 [Bradyrhizobium guangdongense]GGI31648.1 hypothetical protein GCM10010987_65460 [Bradyrhizobium guangdongense]
MTYQDDERRADRIRRNSPIGWAIGAIFVIAVVAAVFFYNGRDVGPQATSNTANNAPSVTTGSNTPAAPAK